MKFVLSFSGGKDSVLAMHEAVAAGHEPVGLLVMFRQEAGRSWVHGIDQPLLDSISKALGLPLITLAAATDTYDRDMERGLKEARSLGAEACVFGDIDTQPHREWDEARCLAAGLQPLLPLWGGNRVELVNRTLELGYRCLIKCIRSDILPESWLGQALDPGHIEELRRLGADPCGENGEYHTVVTDGPLFRRPVPVRNLGIVRSGNISAVNLTV